MHILVQGFDEQKVDAVIKKIGGLKDAPENVAKKVAKNVDVDYAGQLRPVMEKFGLELKIENGEIVIVGLKHNVLPGHEKLMEEVVKLQKKEKHAEEHPKNWVPQSTNSLRYVVPADSKEFLSVLNRMRETMPMVRIVSLQRVQNKRFWDFYSGSKKYLRKKWNQEPAELELFHGTQSLDAILTDESGWRIQYANERGMWGPGCYFAQNALYSHNYSSAGVNLNERQMFLAQVLVGEIKNYGVQPQPGLKLPPPLDDKLDEEGQRRHADSVKGYTNGSYVHIVYENNRAYPKYIITYTAQ